MTREQYPGIDIYIKADSGFSCPAFYELADEHSLRYAIRQASNEVLKQRTARAVKAVNKLYVSGNIKHQHFTSFQYQKKSWHRPQQCYTKTKKRIYYRL